MGRKSTINNQKSTIKNQASRRGFTLIELLMVVAIAPFVMVAVSSLFGTFIRDVPKATRLVQQNTTVLHLLDQVRRDMDQAVVLPEESGGRQADERTLLIVQRGSVVCYRFADGRTVRTLLDGQVEGDPPGRAAALRAEGEPMRWGPQPRVWRARDAVIEWRPWTEDGRAFAIEIRSYLRQEVLGNLRRKLPSSHVFFVGACTLKD